jgi:glycosyltransferase involved in cell wall biosynthesis
MKLVIQVPCYNEEATLPHALHDLPKSIDGVDCIEVLVVDDASTDRTRDIAVLHGVHHIITFTRNRGLAYAFATALEGSLRAGADIIVNTDGDNQYSGQDIEQLIRPILDGNADMVIGTRSMSDIDHFSKLKKLLQHCGSWVVRCVSRTDVRDATSGFRALSREAALRLSVLSSYTYTLETIIQAARKGIAIAQVPVATNPKTRESHLITSIPYYILRSSLTILRVLLMYEPLRVFFTLGSAFLLSGLLVGFRFFYFYLHGGGQGHVQSLILSAILVILGVQNAMLGMLAYLLGVLRHFSEDTNYRIKKMELNCRGDLPTIR